jgi:hypothetical protein
MRHHLGLFALFVLFSVVESFEVLEISEPLEVRDNEAMELTCTGSESWLYCKWNFYDRECAR